MTGNFRDASEVLSLPSAGGTVEGLGETFAPDLFTGTGNYTIPLELPAGRHGLVPDLALTYSTGAGNGPFGSGWNVNVPDITRQTTKGVPRYLDRSPDVFDHDSFILSGSEELVPDPQTDRGVRSYGVRTEGPFARIERIQTTQDDYWIVRSPDGLVSTYGTPGAKGDDPAVVADPEQRSQVFQWRLTRTTDPFGNHIAYAYVRDLEIDSRTPSDQVYLDTIRYVDHDDGYLVSVKFDYDDRPDEYIRNRSGFHIRTRWRCRRIQIRTHVDTDLLVHSYELHYVDDLIATGLRDPDEAPANGMSLLGRIQLVGGDASHDCNNQDQNCLGQHYEPEPQVLPPLDFAYTVFEPRRRKFTVIDGDLPATSLAAPDLELVDLFGDGLPDIVQLGREPQFWRNLGDGRFERPQQMQEAPAGLHLADFGVQLLDADGDGRLELMVTRDGMSGYFSLDERGGWDQHAFRALNYSPSIDLSSPAVALLDLTGNGLTDALYSGEWLSCFFNEPDQGWTAARPAIGDVGTIDLADPHVRIADMTGDGLSDLVTCIGGTITYWPNLGHGRWGARQVMAGERLPIGFDPERVLLGDVDGDGAADLIYVDHMQIKLWINQGSSTWSAPIEVRGTPPYTSDQAVRLTDLHGTGMVGILWTADAGIVGRDHMFFLDFTNGTKPYLLAETDNHMGAVTRVGYLPSTRFRLKDNEQAERHDGGSVGIRSTLPFPVQVVARVEVLDEFSGGKLTTEYEYHHGCWDGVEREFRGFGLVDQFDTESFDDYHQPDLPDDQKPFVTFNGHRAQHFSPPTLTRMWHHLGPTDATAQSTDDAFTNEYWARDPQLLPRPEAWAQLLSDLSYSDRREALRALRGLPVRTERYILDGTDRENSPDEVVEWAYGVSLVAQRQQKTPQDSVVHRRFFPYEHARRFTRWKRGDDPMTWLWFSSDYDPYGQSRRLTEVACPRGWHGLHDAPGEPFLAVRTRLAYAQRDDEDCLIVDRQCRRTRFQIRNDGTQSVLALLQINEDDAAMEVRDDTLQRYDGGGLGSIRDHGAMTCKARLVLTDDVIAAVYASGEEPPDTVRPPPYLHTNGQHNDPDWTTRYPDEFRDLLKQHAGYVRYHEAAGETPTAADPPGGEPQLRSTLDGWYAVTTWRYDIDKGVPGRGLICAVTDPLGNVTTIDHDRYKLLPVRIEDPVGLVTRVQYDPRVLQPALVIDANGNRTAYQYTALGLIASIAELGRDDSRHDDSIGWAGTRFFYDLNAVVREGTPVSLRTSRRVYWDGKANEVTDLHAGVPPHERDRTIDVVEFYDGFGRLLQTRAQAAQWRTSDTALDGGPEAPDEIRIQSLHATPGPNVLVSGATTYDNKGRPIEQYESYFSNGWHYTAASDHQSENVTTTFYDPRGEVVRQVYPDQGELRIVHGVPHDLKDPARYTPTPWETYRYDPNDNAHRTHSAGDPTHWNTPISTTVDALGRTVVQVEYVAAGKQLETRFEHDMNDQLVTVIDAAGRVAARQIFDLTGQLLRTDSIDAGIHRRVFDAAGNVIEQHDSKGAVSLHAYDSLLRPVRRWVQDSNGAPLMLRERFVYGDDQASKLSTAQAAAVNLLGNLHRRYDGAGCHTIERYDIHDNPTEETRAVIADEPLLATIRESTDGTVGAQPFAVNWAPSEGTAFDDHAHKLLDPLLYRVSSRYDALGNLIVRRYPEGPGGHRPELRITYDHAGAMDAVVLDETPHIERITYNAHGRPTLVLRGNGIVTRYAYDPQTRRLRRLRTDRIADTTIADGHTVVYQTEGPTLQDLDYDRDLVGNVTRIRERGPAVGVPGSKLGSDALDRCYTYNARYQLRSATGREAAPRSGPIWDPAPRGVDPTQTELYRQHYRYDAIGNLIKLIHENDHGTASRHYEMAEGSNRLVRLLVEDLTHESSTQTTVTTYAHDPAGNLVQEKFHDVEEPDPSPGGPAKMHQLAWEADDQLAAFVTDTAVVLQLHDATGQRVKQLAWYNDSSRHSTVSLEDGYEHRSWESDAVQGDQHLVHVFDGSRRLVVVRAGEANPEADVPGVQHLLDDHLGNIRVVVDHDGQVIDREDYTPYGETSFGGFVGKRFRYAGNERDELSGLYDGGARHYAPWLGRWISTDPAGMADDVGLYTFVAGNPVTLFDPTGEQSQDADDADRQAGRLSGVVKDGPRLISRDSMLAQEVCDEPVVHAPRPPDPWDMNFREATAPNDVEPISLPAELEHGVSILGGTVSLIEASGRHVPGSTALSGVGVGLAARNVVQEPSGQNTLDVGVSGIGAMTSVAGVTPQTKLLVGICTGAYCITRGVDGLTGNAISESGGWVIYQGSKMPARVGRLAVTTGRWVRDTPSRANDRAVTWYSQASSHIKSLYGWGNWRR